jgi:hypothetical protein
MSYEMEYDIYTQKDLISRIETKVSELGGYLFPDNNKYTNHLMSDIEMLINELKNTYLDKNTYIKLVDRETGEVVMKYFEKGDVGALCYKASQYYAWSDCDDTYRIEEIMCDGRELEYVGWQPCMLFEFVNENGDVVYSAEFPQWDH